MDILIRLVPLNHTLRRKAEQMIDVSPWATSFRYPADDDMSEPQVPDYAKLNQSRKIIALFMKETMKLIV